jgi:hypothetical protein
VGQPRQLALARPGNQQLRDAHPGRQGHPIPLGASPPQGLTTDKGGSQKQRGDKAPTAEGILGESMLETPQPVVDGAEDR